jgi:hypothetical protein
MVAGQHGSRSRSDDFRMIVLEVGVDFLNGACCLERNVVYGTCEGHVPNCVATNGSSGGLFHKYGTSLDLMIWIILVNCECVLMW